MNRGDLREDLRLLLQEETADDFTDARLNALLLMGLRRLERYVLAINPTAFLSMYKTDIVNASSDPDRLKVYPWPAGTIRPVSMRRRATPADTYVALPRVTYHTTHDRSLRGSTSEVGWAPWGQHYFVIDPAPAEAISQGLLVEVVEHLSMAVDTDVPDVALGLHEAIPILAKRRALMETGEQPSADEARQLAELLAEIPKIYDPSSGGQAFIQPVVSKGY